MYFHSIPVLGTETPHATHIYRHSQYPDALISSPDPLTVTINDIVRQGVAKHPNRPMFGQRRILNIVEQEKEVTKKLPGGGEVKETKLWKFFEMTGFEWLTWVEAEMLITAYGNGYRTLGVKPGDNLSIFSETCRDWMFNALACAQHSIVISTSYATLGQEGLTHSLQECKSSTLFTNADLLPVVARVIPHVKTLRNVIYNGTAENKVLEQLKTMHHIKVLSLFELGELGEQKSFECVEPSREDLAMIMYTSGSTGTPKGVMITHANVIAAVAGISVNINPHINQQDEVFLSFLPLAHIFQFVTEIVMMSKGVSIGYGSIKTLTDVSIFNGKGDLRELRPTIMIGVPALFETIRKAIQAKIGAGGFIVQTVFDTAFNLKWALMNSGMRFLAAPLDVLVFNQIKAQVGGRLKLGCVAGAPIPKSTHQFLNVCIAPIFNGYGLTECCSGVAVQDIPYCHTLGNIGRPEPCNEIKLVDVENTEYSSKNIPKPQGELWVRGSNVFKGYYKQDRLTREAITADGWFKTGDIAELNRDGTFTIIDRKKNLVKLSNGEYIALEKLETNYRVSKYIQNICIYADPEESYAVALIHAVEKEIRSFASLLEDFSEIDIDTVELKDICTRKEIRNEVLASCNGIAKGVGFKPCEFIGCVFLTAEEWTPENGMLSPAMKIQRKAIFDKYKYEVKAMYKN
ncbi:UNVERIFIED_CONTAM: long-chain fatty acid-CoA ligase [Siphonaria sp. JEL0065]|nr:long-chain fatty acid-CoA ligase [Siphonaria sp. JEL0065]